MYILFMELFAFACTFTLHTTSLQNNRLTLCIYVVTSYKTIPGMYINIHNNHGNTCFAMNELDMSFLDIVWLYLYIVYR